jgi:D-amino peptidase
MKILIAADMEGITGVVDWSHVREGTADYARFRRWMTADINAAVDGAVQAGADEFIVTDGHGSKTNILIEELHPRARLNSGTGPLSMVQGVDQGVDAAFFIGYHARAGTLNAILCHTVSSSSIANVWINDRLVGEIGMNAATCGYYGVPLLLVSGDETACREAQVDIPGVDTVVTKSASGQKAAACLPPEVTHPLIAAAAQKAVERFIQGGAPKPVVTSEPVRYVVEFFKPDMADQACRLHGAVRLDGKRVALESKTVPQAYQHFRSMMKLASGG